jgi:hypothetical protein
MSDWKNHKVFLISGLCVVFFGAIFIYFWFKSEFFPELGAIIAFPLLLISILIFGVEFTKNLLSKEGEKPKQKINPRIVLLIIVTIFLFWLANKNDLI